MANSKVTVAGALASGGEPLDSDDEVADALLQAARELMETCGIRRLRMDDVARQAGYGRATLYRRFATRDELVWAVVIGEVQRTLRDIEAAILALPTLRERLVEAFAATVEGVRSHPLLNRLLQIEPDLLLPHLTTEGSGALSMARDHLRGLLARGRAAGELGPIDTDVAAEIFIRIAHSLLLTPGGPVPVDDPAGLRTFARVHLAGPLLHLSAHAGGPATSPDDHHHHPRSTA